MNLFILGAVAMASSVVGLIFAKLWRESRDRLYLLFAIAFWLEAIARGARVFLADPSEAGALLVALRIGAYGLILIAIADKNFVRRAR
jgi:hypothetical protein